MKLREVIEMLQEIGEQYPEYLDDPVRVENAIGVDLHTVEDVAAANGPWIITAETTDEGSGEVKLAEWLLEAHAHATVSGIRPMVATQLAEVRTMLISDALVGIVQRGVRERPERHIFRAKIFWATGRGLDHEARCQAQTKDNRQCLNRPMLGITHCHTHTSAQWKDHSKQMSEAWEKLVQDSLAFRGVDKLVERINRALSADERWRQ